MQHRGLTNARRSFTARGALVCAVLLTAAPGFAQRAGDGAPQRLVKLRALATDAKGAPITDLHETDVQVHEDGKQQALVFFRFAGSNRAVPPPGPGEFVNRPAAPPIVLLFDRWNEQFVTTAESWQDVTASLGRMESVDPIYIYILTAHGDLFPVRPLPDPELGLRVPDPPTPQELVAALNEGFKKVGGLRGVEALDPGFRASRTFQALGGLSPMGAIAGPKDLVWVTHGIPLEIRVPGYDWVDFTVPVQDLSEQLAATQVAIYAVDQSSQGPAADPTGESSQTLKMFAELTGGRWYASGRADEALNGALKDARGSYRLAYYSPIRENDRKEHKVRLDSARKTVRLAATQGHFDTGMEPDPEQAQQAAFAEQSRSAFDATEIGLRVKMTRNPGGRSVHLDVHVDPADVLLERRGDRLQGGLGLILSFYNQGLYKNSTAPVGASLSFTQEQFDQALKDGAVISQDVPLDDQIQQVRVIVFDRGLYGLGSVTIPIGQ